MSQTSKRVWLGLALLLTLIATYLAPPPEAEGVTLAERINKPSANPANNLGHAATVSTPGVKPSSPALLAIATRQAEQPLAEIFTVHEWNRPAVPAASPAPLPVIEIAKQAPIPPFTVLGKYDDNGNIAVFLQYNGQNLAAKVGDVLLEQYKVESIAGGVITLRYLPLDQVQTLNFGSTN